MKRRSALQGLIGAGLIPIASLNAFADASARQVQNVKTRFAQALKKVPALLGYASAQKADYHTKALARTGEWPAELKGSLYRNGPGRHEIGDFRYQHWFDGDGMIQAFHLKKDSIEHRARMVRTQKYVEEQNAGRAIYPGFGTNPPNASGTASADQINVANISVLAHHSKLFALWEAGSPYEMNKNDLTTVSRHSFSEATEGVPFSAHPTVEPDGTLWNFGYASGLKKLVLWHLGNDGSVVKTGLVHCDPISMVHDFAVTARHLVFLVCPLHYDIEKSADTFLDLHTWHPDRATQVLIVDKNDFTKVQRLELPAQWVFHFSNAWEDTNGIIHFEAARSKDASILSNTFRDVMQGTITAPAPTHLYAYRIDTKGGMVREAPLKNDASYEFPIVSPHKIGSQHPQLLALSEKQSVHPGLNQISLLDMKQQKEQTYRYADHLMPEEHLLVGTPDSKGRLPWIIGTALNYKDSRTELHLYRAQNLAAGPFASAHLPYALPLGLHGKFVSA